MITHDSPERFDLPPEAEVGRQDSSDDASARETPERFGKLADFTAEIRREVESAKRGIAQAVWAEPANFAVAAVRDSAAEMGRFLEKFAAIGDDMLATEELKRSRDAVRSAGGSH